MRLARLTIGDLQESYTSDLDSISMQDHLFSTERFFIAFLAELEISVIHGTNWEAMDTSLVVSKKQDR